MLADSGILQVLQRDSVPPNGNALCLYGDTAYPHRQVLQAPFKGAVLTPMETEWNKAMSKVKIEVEWIFGDIIKKFSFLDFKKKLKVQLSAVGKMYIVCTLMQNARSCLYGSSTSDYFGIKPPTIYEYFQ